MKCTSLIINCNCFRFLRRNVSSCQNVAQNNMVLMVWKIHATIKFDCFPWRQNTCHERITHWKRSSFVVLKTFKSSLGQTIKIIAGHIWRNIYISTRKHIYQRLLLQYGRLRSRCRLITTLLNGKPLLPSSNFILDLKFG